MCLTLPLALITHLLPLRQSDTEQGRPLLMMMMMMMMGGARSSRCYCDSGTDFDVPQAWRSMI